MSVASDLYARLGVERGASEEELKRAFRRAALETHPDKPGGSNEKFQAVNEAYQILGNPQKKAEYDATGRVPMDGDGDGVGGNGGNVDLSEILGSLFGRGMAGGFGTPEGIPFPMFGMGGGGPPGMGGKAPRGPNKAHEIGVTLADLWAGKTFTLNMKRDVLCGDCGGAGGSRMEACGGCAGRGFRLRRQQMGPMVVASQEPCEICRGAGQKAADRCDGCEGRRVVGRDSVLDVRIEPGMQEGDRLVFPGQCSESPDFEAPGDVVLVLRAAAGDPAASVWMRRGADLMCEVRLGVAESMLGWERRMEGHPSGRPLEIVWTDGMIRDGEVLRVPGWGMPVRGAAGKYGDLRLVCRVDRMEGSWSEEQRRALQTVWSDWKAPTAAGREGVCVPQRVAVHPNV
jgi:DnaJ family protein A protein 2